MQFQNFGKNVSFVPANAYEPTSESEVLEILAKHKGQQIRVVGRMHSWSDVIRGTGVVLNLHKMNAVQVEQRDGESWVVLGSGCQVKRAIAELDKHGLTLPALGLIDEQSIAGAAATGTHGAGRHSISHYIDEIRIAIYDTQTNEPTVRTIRSGPELEAARCSLGCMGVVLSVGIRCREQYRIEQKFQFVKELQSALDAETTYPIQQFFLLPFRWDYLLQMRRETQRTASVHTWVFRLYWFLTIDLGLHLILIFFRRWLRSNWLIKCFYKVAVPLVLIRNWKVVDKSQHHLTMKHALFRHIEIEVFVRRQELDSTLRFVESLLRFLAGDSRAISGAMWEQLESYDLADEVRACAKYVHHYPICIRKVLGDAAMISMTSGVGEEYYAVSFISFDHPTERAGFNAFADVLCKTTAAMFNARPHWGKICPIEKQSIKRLYPRLNEFREICDDVDPTHVFRNEWVGDLLESNCSETSFQASAQVSSGCDL